MATTQTFDVDALLDDCRTAIAETQPTLAVQDVLERALGDAPKLAAALAQDEGGIFPLFVADDLTVLNVIWAPGMRLFPHDHRMWAAIAIYGGVEDNSFFRRSPEGLVRSGGKVANEGDVLLLGDDAIHAVYNPGSTLTGAIHVYGGQFFTTPRSEWDPETLEEHPFDIDDANRAFADANEAWHARS